MALTFIASHCAMMFLVIFITLALHDKEMLFANAEMKCDLLDPDHQNITRISCFDGETGNHHGLKCNKSFLCGKKMKADTCFVKFSGNKFCELNCTEQDVKSCTLMDLDDVTTTSTDSTETTSAEITSPATTAPEVICRMVERSLPTSNITWITSVFCKLNSFACNKSHVCQSSTGEFDTCFDYEFSKTGYACKFNCLGNRSVCVFEQMVPPTTTSTMMTIATTTEKPTICEVKTTRDIDVSTDFLTVINCTGNDGNINDYKCEEVLRPLCVSGMKHDACHIRNSEITCDLNCEVDMFQCALNYSQVKTTTPKPVEYCVGTTVTKNDTGTEENVTIFTCKEIAFDWIGPCESNESVTLVDPINSNIKCHITCTENDYPNECRLDDPSARTDRSDGLNPIWVVLILLVAVISLALIGVLACRMYKKKSARRRGSFDVAYSNQYDNVRNSATSPQ